jgi:thiol-disulfide isomerase/thioredoxin
MEVDQSEIEERVSRVRPKIFSKQVLLGAGAGILAGILFTIAGAYILSRVLDPSNTAKLEKDLKPPRIPSQIIADYNWTVHSLDGREFNMADAKGKVVFVNFWATWCLPCRAEMSSIQRLYDKVKNEGVIFLCVSKEDGATVTEFVREKGYTFPIYTRSPELPPGFEVESIPTTFIIGPDGKMALRHVGAAKWDDEGSVNFIRGLRSRT